MTEKDAGEPAREVTMGAKRSDKGFTPEERAAMRERAKEQKAEARAEKNRAAGESALLQKIAEMAEPDRAMAGRLHGIVKASAPALTPKTWYGMPAYADEDGKVVCFFQGAEKARPNGHHRDLRARAVRSAVRKGAAQGAYVTHLARSPY